MRDRTPAVYILTNQKGGALYTGVTADPLGRIAQHRAGSIPGFAARYRLKRLVHIEFFGDMENAILREKQIKRWHRDWKIRLIEESNPEWRDLATDYGFDPLRGGSPIYPNRLAELGSASMVLR
ncbi:GIY-YIG nuclease family protein [Hephaestia mangrovi]|uniref:GIY-YIG nuclease family protein n=1 Tax=Hephaestia mangrovi TaxID=2873268 RepID=UPI001CA6B605|nr:GIY-YIG nuclease family protein [Hephaestia mangrovi]MBY8826878.1 GIY-YIG nuclease family protein [Hephaestia mangrovi]